MFNPHIDCKEVYLQEKWKNTFMVPCSSLSHVLYRYSAVVMQFLDQSGIKLRQICYTVCHSSIHATIVLDVAFACSVWTAGLRSYVSSEKQLVCADWQLIALWFNLVRDFQKCCVHSDLEIGALRSLCVQNFNAPKKGDKGPPWWCHSMSASRPSLQERGQDRTYCDHHSPTTLHHGPSISPWPSLNQRTHHWCEVQNRNLSWTDINSKYFWP